MATTKKLDELIVNRLTLGKYRELAAQNSINPDQVYQLSDMDKLKTASEITAEISAAVESGTAGALHEVAWTDIKNRPDMSDYATKTDLSAKADATSVYTKTAADGRFQPKGTYLTPSAADSKYQAKGDYLAKSEAAKTYQPKGDYATVSKVQELVNALIDQAPGTLDTFKEIADALGNDPNLATTLITKINAKADKSDTESKLAQKADKTTTEQAIAKKTGVTIKNWEE